MKLRKSSRRCEAISAIDISFSRTVGFDIRTSDVKSVEVAEALSVDHISCFWAGSFDTGASDSESA